jgi:hypothetical protein
VRGDPNVHPHLNPPPCLRRSGFAQAGIKGEEIRLRIFMVRACTPKWRFGTQAWVPSGHGALIRK